MAALAAASRLVSLICPGFHSIFSTVSLDWVEDGNSPADSVPCVVLSTDGRFSLVTQSIQGAGIAGEVESFVKVPLVEQASIYHSTKTVNPGTLREMLRSSWARRGDWGSSLCWIIAAGGGQMIAPYAVGPG